MIVKLLTEHHLEFLSLKGGCTGPSESTLVIMSNCWKSRALAQIITISLSIFALIWTYEKSCLNIYMYAKKQTHIESVATICDYGNFWIYLSVSHCGEFF